MRPSNKRVFLINLALSCNVAKKEWGATDIYSETNPVFYPSIHGFSPVILFIGVYNSFDWYINDFAGCN